MSESSTPEERTEKPTDRRMGELRKEGAIHQSQDITQVASLFAGFLIVTALAPALYHDLQKLMVHTFRLIAMEEPITIQFAMSGFKAVIWMMGPKMAVIVVLIAIVSSLAVFLQTKWNVKGQWIKFDFNFINPLKGIANIFSVNNYIQVGKAIVKLCVFLPIGYFALKQFAPQMVLMTHTTINSMLSFCADALSSVFWKIFTFWAVLAIVDYFWGKYRWFGRNNMTKDEVKDERKSVEGDEMTKRKIIAKGLARAAQRIALSVPRADVVVTNPTHYAVALKYDRDTMVAPTVVAKGKDYMALRIRELARQSGVPVLERKVLARGLYQSVEVGSSIPRDLFKAVAEVLAYVYRLKNPYRALKASRPTDSRSGGQGQTHSGGR